MAETEIPEGVASELRRLGACADIPAYRRRQLLALADRLEPVAVEQHLTADPFADGYYRRPGLRLRLAREEEVFGPERFAPRLLIGVSP